MSVAVGTFRSLSTSPGSQHPGFGSEVAGRFALASGFALGVAARYIVCPGGDDRAAVFLDGRYAPTPTPSRRARPVIGLRLGPCYGGGAGDGDGSPLFGIETGAVCGVAVGIGPRMRVAILGDMGIVLTRNDSRGTSRRLYPA